MDVDFLEKYTPEFIGIPKVLWCLRISSSILLIFMIYWIFSDAEFTSIITFNIPLYYPGLYELFYSTQYQSKKISILFLPIIFNMALWYLSYKSYIFIRGILYIELCRTFVILVAFSIGLVGSIIFPMQSNYLLGTILSASYFCLIVYMIHKIKSDNYKKVFCDEGDSNDVTKRKMITAVCILGGVYLVMYGLLIYEGWNQNQSISSMSNVKQYHVEGHSSSEDYIGYRNKLNFSLDGERFVNVLHEGINRGNIGIFETKMGEKIKILDTKKANYCVFTPDGEYVILRKDRVTKDGKRNVAGENRSNHEEVIFEEWNINTGKKERSFNDSRNLLDNDRKREFYVDKISFSTDGRYISTTGKGISIWDYQTGKLMAFYDIRSKIKSLEWLSSQEYLVMQVLDPDYGADKSEIKEEKSIYSGKVDTDGKIVKFEKEKMTQDFQSKTQDLKNTKVLIKKGVQQEYAAVLINGEPEDGIWFRRSYLDIWNVKEETKIFSLRSNYTILNAKFYSDGERIVILEELRDNKGRITVWNINTMIKEKMIFVPNPENVIDIKFIDGEKKLILLKNPISIIDLI